MTGYVYELIGTYMNHSTCSIEEALGEPVVFKRRDSGPTRALPVVEFSTGIQNYKGFWLEINCSQMKNLVATCQKLGTILEMKVI